MSYEELAGISAKIAERTREDGSSIGNALKTMFTRISKVAAMPSYEDEIDNETVSKAAEALHEIGVEVYNADGSFRDITKTLTELNEKWDTLTDAQKSYISYQVAATRQSSKFKSMLEAWEDGMDLAAEATTASGNALENQEKYQDSYAGKMQKLSTIMQEFWLNTLNSDDFKKLLDSLISIAEWLNRLAENGKGVKVVFGGIAAAFTSSSLLKMLINNKGNGRGKSNPHDMPLDICLSMCA